MTFWGSSRAPSHAKPHESPLSMTFPLCVLAFFSVFSGWLCIPHGLSSILPGHPHNKLEQWIKPLLAPFEKGHGSLSLEFTLMTVIFCGVVISSTLAFVFYVLRPEQPARNAKKNERSLSTSLQQILGG